MICRLCLRYHKINKMCKKIQLQCINCKHKQYTLNKDYSKLKCGVCNKYKMEVI